MAWTIDKIKNQLPLVKIKVGKQVMVGDLSGRMLPGAVVWVYRFRNPGLTEPRRFIFTWKEVADILNNDIPLEEVPTKPKAKKKGNKK